MVKDHYIFLIYIILGVSFSTFAQAIHPDDFSERYTLKQVVVLSRHDIRSPLMLQSISYTKAPNNYAA